MYKARVMLLLLGLFWFFGQGVPLSAQEEDEEESDSNNEEVPIETDWDGYISDLYSRGDTTFAISLGAFFPTVFLNNGTVVDHHIDPPVGGLASLAFGYFLNGHFFLGAEVGVNIGHTLGKNSLFIVPYGLRAGWQFLAGRFEFPLTVTVGGATQRYLDDSYAGFMLKGAVGAYFRFNSDWSFGVNTDWSWYPQWPRENGKPVPEKNMDANMLGVTISARYHL